MLGSRVGILGHKQIIYVYPPQISNLHLWYDGKDNATIKNAANTNAIHNDPVATWEDKSGGGFHLAQATGSKRPLYKVTGLNNSSSLYFDGGDDMSNLVYNMDTQYFTIISVHNQIASKGPIWDLARNHEYKKFFPNYHPDNTGYILKSNTAWQSFAGIPFNTSTISIAKYNQTPSTLSVITYNTANGLQTPVNAADYTANSVFNGFSIGSRVTNGSEFFTGHMAEIIVYNKTLSETEVTDIIIYLRSKWNI